MSLWFPWFIHGDTGFQQGVSLFSMARHCRPTDGDARLCKVPKGVSLFSMARQCCPTDGNAR